MFLLKIGVISVKELLKKDIIFFEIGGQFTK